MTTARANNPNFCRSCGLETCVPHATTRECIEALEREKNALTEHLRQRQPNDKAVSPSPSDRDNPKPVPPRLALVR